MSIREKDEAVNAERQQQQIDELHSKEAEARPDAVHRAVVFLLDQCKLNNRDASREANYHLRTLDEKLAIPEKLEEIEGLELPDPVETAKTAAEPTPARTRKRGAADTAALLKTSKRFQR